MRLKFLKKQINCLFLAFLLLVINSCSNLNRRLASIESLAFEGINIDFKFNLSKPTFGDLFLITGRENPNFASKSREFESLNHLGFEQTDDYFAIKNDTEIGDDIIVWLFPIKNNEPVYHDNGPFDTIRISYTVLRNSPKKFEVLEKVYTEFKSELDVTPVINGKQVNNFEEVRELYTKTIKYCRTELKVEPGSPDALKLDW